MWEHKKILFENMWRQCIWRKCYFVEDKRNLIYIIWCISRWGFTCKFSFSLRCLWGKVVGVSRTLGQPGIPPFWPKKRATISKKIGSGFLRKPDPWGYQILPNSGGSGVASSFLGPISNWTQKGPWICGRVFLAKAENPPHGHFWPILVQKDHGVRVTVSKNRVRFSEKTWPMRLPDPPQFWGILGSQEKGGFWVKFPI